MFKTNLKVNKGHTIFLVLLFIKVLFFQACIVNDPKKNARCEKEKKRIYERAFLICKQGPGPNDYHTGCLMDLGIGAIEPCDEKYGL